MQASIYKELLSHIIDTLENQNQGTDTLDLDELHHLAFNADYYIIGYYNAEQWLLKHDLTAFEAIAEVIQYQEHIFGEMTFPVTDINAEYMVNQLAHFYGGEVLSNYDLDQNYDDLLAELKESTYHAHM
jgi:hypothetical protein